MNLLECLRSALIAIRSNKLRSLLTMLGIIIGISAVITITMLGSTLSASVSNAVAEFGGWIYREYYDIIKGGRKRFEGSKSLRNYIVELGARGERYWLAERNKAAAE